MQSQYNMRNPAVKRLMKEAQELREPTEQYHAQPLEDNLFEWHFTIRGPADSEFDGGVYHGRIILPPEYPMKPPSIILLTPNGRFEIFKKICLSISGHHPESWQPSWSIRTALLAIIGFMPTHGNGAIGSLDYSADERKVLARRSQEFKCSDCGTVTDKLKAVTEASKAETEEAKELASQINFQAENKANGKDKGDKKENKSESDGKTENKTLASEASTTPVSSSQPSSPNTTTVANAQTMPGFPGFNSVPGMPFAQGFAMPPPFMFPPGMLPPSSTTGNSASMNPPNPFAMPPGYMMPPFWPPMMHPGASPTTNPSQVPQGPFPFPPPPFFAMMAQQNVLRNQQGQSSGSAVPAPGSRSATTTVSSASAMPRSSSQISSTGQSSATSAAGSTTTQSAPTTTASPATPSSSSSSTTTTAPAAGTSVAQPASATSVRQRNVAQPAMPQASPVETAANRAPRQQGQFQNATVPSEHNIRQSEHPLVILLMVLIGIAILALLVRRVYMMNTWRFDTDF